MPTRPALSIFLVFLKLGCTAFGGPVAHLGYFHAEFLERRRWLNEREFADLVALCQFLPGPASSQVAFAIGLRKAGMAGAFGAWLAFTLPSAILMIGFAFGLTKLGDLRGAGWIAGLKLAAVAVVADAILTMASRLCPDAARRILALVAAAVLLAVDDALWQIMIIVLGGAAGGFLFRDKPGKMDTVPSDESVGFAGWPCLAVFGVLLAGLPLLEYGYSAEWVAVAEGFYRAGSLVFGGGHVLLPLLEKVTVGPGWVDRETFLAGYGAAQALPGPLFAFAGFLGAKMNHGPGGIVGALLALLAINLPSWLLLLGALPRWNRLRRLASARAMLMGTNAAVVGLLLAAFLHPICSSSITGPDRLVFAATGFCLLRFARIAPWLLVLLCALAGSFLFSAP